VRALFIARAGNATDETPYALSVFEPADWGADESCDVHHAPGGQSKGQPAGDAHELLGRDQAYEDERLAVRLETSRLLVIHEVRTGMTEKQREFYDDRVSDISAARDAAKRATIITANT
jgi:hypothetical protein